MMARYVESPLTFPLILDYALTLTTVLLDQRIVLETVLDRSPRSFDLSGARNQRPPLQHESLKWR